MGIFEQFQSLMLKHKIHIYMPLSMKIKGKATINTLLVRKLMAEHEEEHLDCRDETWLNDQNSLERRPKRTTYLSRLNT